MEPIQQPVQQKKVRTTVEIMCEFTTTQERLARALRSLSGVAGRNPSLPILSNVLLKREEGELRLSTTDLEVGVSVWLPGKLRGDGALTVPLRPFSEYVQNLPAGQVTFRIASGTLTITAERARAVFQGETAENFPLIPQLEHGAELILAPAEVRQALDQVLYAVATEDTRPELSGVFLRGEGSTLTLAATDSYRLGEARVTLRSALTSPVSVILPFRAAHEMRRGLEGEVSEATLRVGDGQVVLLTPGIQVVSRSIEGTYPDYTQIIPRQSPTTVEVDRLQLLRAVRASAVFGGSSANRVTLEAGVEGLRVAATTPEMGETETTLSAEVEGEASAISFNERFLRDALGALSSERVRIGLGTSTAPVVLRLVLPASSKEAVSDASSVVALIMPIRV